MGTKEGRWRLAHGRDRREQGRMDVTKRQKPRVWLASAAAICVHVFAGGAMAEEPRPASNARLDLAIGDLAIGNGEVKHTPSADARAPVVSTVAGDLRFVPHGGHDVSAHRRPLSANSGHRSPNCGVFFPYFEQQVLTLRIRTCQRQ